MVQNIRLIKENAKKLEGIEKKLKKIQYEKQNLKNSIDCLVIKNEFGGISGNIREGKAILKKYLLENEDLVQGCLHE